MIRKGVLEDVEEINNLYKSVIKTNAQACWVDDVYPNKNTAIDGIKNNELYVKIFNNEVAGTFILNTLELPVYKSVKWNHNSNKNLVIHTFCISPKYQKKGFGRELMLFAESYCKEIGLDCIRLDTYAESKTASAFYEKLGYTLSGVVAYKFEKYDGLIKCFEKKII